MAHPCGPATSASWWSARWLRLGLGLSLLAATLAVVDRDVLAARIAAVDARYLALGGLIALPQLALCALRWRYTARRLGVPLRFREALREYGLSVSLNLLLPFGVLGDGLRVLRHRERLAQARVPARHTQLTAALNAALLERSSGQLVVGLCALVAAPLWWVQRADGPRMALAACTGALALCALPLALVRLLLKGAATHRALPAPLRVLASDFQRGLFARRAFAVQLGLSAGVLLTLIAQLYCALAGVGLSLSPLAAARVFPLVLLAMTIPLSLAGFGPREAATAGLYHALALSEADGAAFALAYGTLSLMAAMPALLCFAWARR
jgi:glycosyltransferase 2 family protein